MPDGNSILTRIAAFPDDPDAGGTFRLFHAALESREPVLAQQRQGQPLGAVQDGAVRIDDRLPFPAFPFMPPSAGRIRRRGSLSWPSPTL